MSTKTLSIDGLTPNSSRRRDEVVLFDRRQQPDSAKSDTTNKVVDSLRPLAQSTKIQSKVNANKAKQRGWEVVAQARLDAKHRDRHNQRQAAQRAAHHHRQRHDITNYAQAHAATLELNDTATQSARNSYQPNVSLKLKLQNLFQSKALKVSATGLVSLALAVGVFAFVQTDSSAGVPQPSQTGQVQAITSSTVDQSRLLTQPAVTDEAETVEPSSTQVEQDSSDGNLDLWSSTLED